MLSGICHGYGGGRTVSSLGGSLGRHARRWGGERSPANVALSGQEVSVRRPRPLSENYAVGRRYGVQHHR
jgi:hypothetical protein